MENKSQKTQDTSGDASKPVLVAGATGATGRLLASELLERGVPIRAVVRSAERLPAAVREHPGCTVVEASLLDLSDEDLVSLVDGCGAVVSCLGHSLTLRGMFGPPRRLVTQAVQRLCRAIRMTEPDPAVRFILMNTAGNRLHGETVPWLHAVVITLLRILVPPHADNEDAAEFLQVGVGLQDPALEWVAVRPDSLTDKDPGEGYELHPSPTRSAILDPGTASRANVARGMADLVTDDALWRRWAGHMPVLYDRQGREET